MSRPPLNFLFPRDDGVPDAALLRRYADGRDESAFELLVRRYADAVWTVCRATAGDHHAAEDAFQAVFLTLARKAGGVREHLAGWLYRVAYHAALKARPATRPHPPEQAEPSADRLPGDEVAILHAELAALPNRYRLPLLLCDLEGLTHAEAAKQLGWPVGSVSGRLVRARERLKAKLVRRGLAPAAVALSLTPLHAASPLIRLATSAATGGLVPPSVAALAHGVLTAMCLAKLKLIAAFAAGVVGLAGAVTVLGVSAQDIPTKAAPTPDEPPVRPATTAAKEEPTRPLADAKQRAFSTNQMKIILLACHNFHDVNGHLPTDVLDKDGKPLLSWRVLLLPYLGESALYKQFKFNEPWDSDHNKKPAETVVKAFTNGHEPKNTTFAMTFFQRPTGTGTMNEPGKKGLLTDVTDGLSNTIALVEAEKAVEWAKPDDLAFDLNKPADVRGPFSNVIHCGMGDGSVRTFAGGIGKEVAKIAISRSGKEPFDLDNYLGLGSTATTPEEVAKEAAMLKKDINDTTAALAKMLEENQKLRTELFTLKTNRPEKAGNGPLADQLVALERMLEAERQERDRLQRVLKREKGEAPAKKE